MTTEAPSKRDWGFGELGEVLFGELGFVPTGEAQAAILRSTKRFKLVAGGEQSGKSFCAAQNWLLRWFEDRARWPGEGLLYWLVAADYDRTRREFGYIAEDLEKLGFKPEVTKRVDPGAIEVVVAGKPIVRLETKSAKDPRTLAMTAPNGIIVCEASQVDLETYQKCLARVAPKKGWMYLSGTYESSLGWFPGLAAAWGHGSVDEQSWRLPSTTNHHMYPGGENDPEIVRLKANSSDAFFMERIMGVAAPPKGMVFTEFRPDVHIREAEWVEELPVYIWEDPGYGHAHAIEVAQVLQGGQVVVFDEIYEQGIITEDLIEVCMARPWWKSAGKKLVIDPSYKGQHHAMGSVEELWLKRTGLAAYGTKVKIAEGTERLKSFLKLDVHGEPRIVFSPRCRGILSEMGAYPNPFDGQTRTYNWKTDRDGNVIGEEPEDKNNDGCKAVIYGLVEEFGFVNSSANNNTLIMMRHGGSGRARSRSGKFFERHKKA